MLTNGLKTTKHLKEIENERNSGEKEGGFMIFMNIETGFIYELLILSLSEENNELFPVDGRRAFRLEEFTLQGTDDLQAMRVSDFYKYFAFIGFI